jgi:drug/metabolite transporter (DMT)-like permease
MLAWLILDEAVAALQGIAMACVIGALAMIVRGQTKPAAKAAKAAAKAAA